MLDKKAKQKIIEKFKVHEKDTGSSEIQIAILTYEIRKLAEHLRLHRKDHSSRRGLMRKIGERRRLLGYLKKENQKSWEEIMKKLKIKMPQALRKKSEAEISAELIEDEIKEAAEISA